MGIAKKLFAQFTTASRQMCLVRTRKLPRRAQRRRARLQARLRRASYRSEHGCTRSAAASTAARSATAASTAARKLPQRASRPQPPPAFATATGDWRPDTSGLSAHRRGARKTRTSAQGPSEITRPAPGPWWRAKLTNLSDHARSLPGATPSTARPPWLPCPPA